MQSAISLCQSSGRLCTVSRVCICLRCRSVYVVKPASTQHGKNQGSVVCGCTSACQQHQMADDSMMVGMDAVQSIQSVRDLGIHFDSDLTIQTHVTQTVSSCFAVLHQICSISHSVGRQAHTWFGMIHFTSTSVRWWLYRRSITDYDPQRRADTGSQRSAFPDSHPSTNWGRCCLTSVNVPLS